MAVSNKPDTCKHYNPIFPFLGTHPQKGMHLCSKTHGSTIRKGPKLKRTEMSSYHRPTCILSIHTVENETAVEKIDHNYMQQWGGTHKRNVKRKKPDTKDDILYDMNFKKRPN